MSPRRVAASAAVRNDPSPGGAARQAPIRSSAVQLATAPAVAAVTPATRALTPPPPASAQIAARPEASPGGVQRAAVRPAGTVKTRRSATDPAPAEGRAVLQRAKIGGHRSRTTSAPVPATSQSQPATVTSAPAVPAPQAPPTSAQRESEFDRLVAMLEDRILAQLERRGGRYHGVF